ncbi:MAG: hypothetical protein RI513_05925, partial [Balneolaceae bacterium]|nr:hypothetical protein [Balneolaceae bacterium]
MAWLHPLDFGLFLVLYRLLLDEYFLTTLPLSLYFDVEPRELPSQYWDQQTCPTILYGLQYLTIWPVAETVTIKRKSRWQLETV